MLNRSLRPVFGNDGTSYHENLHGEGSCGQENLMPNVEAEGPPATIAELNIGTGNENTLPAENIVMDTNQTKEDEVQETGPVQAALPAQEADPVLEVVMEIEMNEAIDIGQSANTGTTPNNQLVPSERRVRFESIDPCVGMRSVAMPARRARRAISVGDRVHLHQEPTMRGGVQLRRSNRIRMPVERLNFDFIKCCVCKKKIQHFISSHLYGINTVCSFECFRKIR